MPGLFDHYFRFFSQDKFALEHSPCGTSVSSYKLLLVTVPAFKL